MHGIGADELFASEARATSENGLRVASDGAALGKEKLAPDQKSGGLNLRIGPLFL